MTREEIRTYVLDCLAGRLSCKDFVELVTDYLDGSMPLWTRIRFQLHLGLCLGCHVYLKQMKQSIETLGRLPSDPPPSELRDQLIERFRSWKQADKQR